MSKTLIASLSVPWLAFAASWTGCGVVQTENPQPLVKNQSPPQSDSHPHNDSNLDARRLVELWERLLADSQFAVVRCRLDRRRTDFNVLEKDAEPEEKYRIVLFAQAVMKRDSNRLVVWEGEPGNGDRPVLKLECVNGQVREDLWYPAFEQYRTIRYPAPTPFGANDTKYENGCMIGGLLSTWLGVYEGARTQIRRMREAEIAPEPVEISGKTCRAFRYTFQDEDQPNTMTYFLDAEGRLVR